MVDRKIIFKCRTGSYLYGTNHANSDEDFQGVFIPSTDDLLSLDKCPDEWTENVKNHAGDRNQAGDVDCKYFSLQKFMRLAAQGQPGQLEMLFAPDNMILIKEPEWDLIIKNRDLFLSKKGISPFIGFALAQSYKAIIKGENLRQIRKIIQWGRLLSTEELRGKLSNLFTSESTPSEAVLKPKANGDGDTISPKLKYYVNTHGFAQVSVAGRDWDQNCKTKDFISAIKRLEDKYGSRVEAAAKMNYDYKSLGHAVRLLDQAKEFLQDQTIILPRPNSDYLKTILLGEIDDSNIDWFDLLTQQIDDLRQNVEPNSPLPENPNWKKISKLCRQILQDYIVNGA